MSLRATLLVLFATCVAGCAQPLPRMGTAAPAATAVIDGPQAAFACGDTPVQTRFGQEAMSLTLDGRTLVLAQVVSASGARYAGLGPDGPVEFWNRGSTAQLTVGPRAYPECVEVRGTGA